MTNSKKWYVVWEGTESGICETWEECYLRTHNHPGARYKAFDSARDAIEAYRRGLDVANDPYAMIRAIVHAEISLTSTPAVWRCVPLAPMPAGLGIEGWMCGRVPNSFALVR